MSEKPLPWFKVKSHIKVEGTPAWEIKFHVPSNDVDAVVCYVIDEDDADFILEKVNP